MDRAFRWVIFSALGIGVLTLGVLLAYVTIKGWPRLNLALIANMPSIRFPARAGA